MYECSAIVQTAKDIMWIATYTGLCKYNKADGSEEWFTPKTTNGAIKDSMITCLFHEIEKNRLWVGTYTKGMYCVDLKNSRNNLSAAISSVSTPSNAIRRFEKDKNGRLWIATYDIGIITLDTEIYLFDALNKETNNLGSNFVFDLLNTSDNKMWACCINGKLTRLIHREVIFLRKSHRTSLRIVWNLI